MKVTKYRKYRLLDGSIIHIIQTEEFTYTVRKTNGGIVCSKYELHFQKNLGLATEAEAEEILTFLATDNAKQDAVHPRPFYEYKPSHGAVSDEVIWDSSYCNKEMRKPTQ